MDSCVAAVPPTADAAAAAALTNFALVFLPRPLLDPPIQALDSDRVAEGIAFMQGLANWCSTASDPQSFALESGSLTVLRASA